LANDPLNKTFTTDEGETILISSFIRYPGTNLDPFEFVRMKGKLSARYLFEHWYRMARKFFDGHPRKIDVAEALLDRKTWTWIEKSFARDLMREMTNQQKSESNQ